MGALAGALTAAGVLLLLTGGPGPGVGCLGSSGPLSCARPVASGAGPGPVQLGAVQLGGLGAAVLGAAVLAGVAGRLRGGDSRADQG